MKILAFGEILWDVYPDKAYIGGAPLNFGGHLAKQGVEVHLFSAVGKDKLGEDALDVLKAWGVGTDYVSVIDVETGKCLVTLDKNSVPSYNLLSNVAWDRIEGDINESFDVLYFGTLALRSEVNFNTVTKLLKKGCFSEIFCDMNIRAPHYSSRTVKLALENATIVKISDEELNCVMTEAGLEAGAAEDCAIRLSQAYPNLKTVLVTLGEKGSFAYVAEDKKFYRAEGKKVKVASTVGAGDSFSASFLCRYLEKKSVDECLEHATNISAYVVSCYDAVPDYKEI